MTRLDSRLLQLIVCPTCKGPLKWFRDKDCLVCFSDRLSYPIRDGIPVLLEREASPLDDSFDFD